MRPHNGSLASSPIVVGAVTVLVAIVVVFLAYNAHTGLPFTPTYRVTATLPNAAALVPGNEVRIGGSRVGLIETIEPVRATDGSYNARLELKLSSGVEPLPRDSTVVVRSRSSLGLKYLEIDQGSEPGGYPDGSVIPLAATRRRPVELDEVLQSFDEPTRAAMQRNLLELSDALAGRGAALNAAVGRLPRTLAALEPAMRNLSAPATRLDRLVPALAATASELAPVADLLPGTLDSLDTTFTTLAESGPSVHDTLTELPRTEGAALRALPNIRPLLDSTAGLMADLRPGAGALRKGSPDLASALERGAPVLRDSPRLSRELPPTAEALLAFNDDPAVRGGLARATGAAEELNPALAYIAPVQTKCKYVEVLAGNLDTTLSAGNELGAWLRFIVFDVPKGPNSEGSPSSGIADGGGDGRNFLHANPYPNAAAPGQKGECEAGREEFIPGEAVVGNVPGNQGSAARSARAGTGGGGER